MKDGSNNRSYRIPPLPIDAQLGTMPTAHASAITTSHREIRRTILMKRLLHAGQLAVGYALATVR
jgi:hypothetical protein